MTKHGALKNLWRFVEKCESLGIAKKNKRMSQHYKNLFQPSRKISQSTSLRGKLWSLCASKMCSTWVTRITRIRKLPFLGSTNTALGEDRALLWPKSTISFQKSTTEMYLKGMLVGNCWKTLTFEIILKYIKIWGH